MNKRTKSVAKREEVVTSDITEACARYGLGKPTMRRVAEDAGAVVRIGRRYLIHLGKMDEYMRAAAE